MQIESKRACMNIGILNVHKLIFFPKFQISIMTFLTFLTSRAQPSYKPLSHAKKGLLPSIVSPIL